MISKTTEGMSATPGTAKTTSNWTTEMNNEY